jgi:two-component system response regulator
MKKKKWAGKRILVVDDDELWRRIVREALHDMGLSVFFAKDGHEAYMRLLQKSYDLLITDTNMPGMNGLELIELIRKTGSNIPIILFFSQLKASTLTAADALKMGASVVIEKEQAVPQLAELVEEFLRRREN